MLIAATGAHEFVADAKSNFGQIEGIGQLLAVSAARLSTAAVSVPGMRSMPFRYQVNRLLQTQRKLEDDYRRLKREQEAQLQGLFLPIVIAGSAIFSLGAWAWKQHRETAEVESRQELFDQLVRDGMDAEKAAQVAFGGGGGISDILSKLMLLGALGLGAFILVKMWK